MKSSNGEKKLLQSMHKGKMNRDTIIVSMTTWPPRFTSAVAAMSEIVEQRKAYNLADKVHCVLTLSEEEVSATYSRQEACELMRKMDEIGVEVIIDRGNIRSHKKLMPTLAKYPCNPILVVDDDCIQREGWLNTFVCDHSKHPDDIIYGTSRSRMTVNNGIIHEERKHLTCSKAGEWSVNLKPANGAAGTLYPACTFNDDRFFDRKLMMTVSPSSDETWQYAFAMIEHPSFRCLSDCNFPYNACARQDCALWNTNRNLYDKIHNDIAHAVPDYLEALERLL